MAPRASLLKRWEDYRPSKTVLIWSCAGCVVATMIIGFSWGGWVTGGTAGKMAAEAVAGARAELAASVCVDRFSKGADATAQLASLKGTDSWKRDDFMEKGGWVTLAGATTPISGAASLCARHLIDAKSPTGAVGSSG